MLWKFLESKQECNKLLSSQRNIFFYILQEKIHKQQTLYTCI